VLILNLKRKAMQKIGLKRGKRVCECGPRAWEVRAQKGSAASRPGENVVKSHGGVKAASEVTHG